MPQSPRPLIKTVLLLQALALTLPACAQAPPQHLLSGWRQPLVGDMVLAISGSA